MSRQGIYVNVEDPIYMLDKNRGYFRMRSYNGGYVTLESLKHINRDAYDANYFDLIVDGKKYRIQKDELLAGLQYV